MAQTQLLNPITGCLLKYTLTETWNWKCSQELNPITPLWVVHKFLANLACLESLSNFFSFSLNVYVTLTHRLISLSPDCLPWLLCCYLIASIPIYKYIFAIYSTQHFQGEISGILILLLYMKWGSWLIIGLEPYKLIVQLKGMPLHLGGVCQFS